MDLWQTHSKLDQIDVKLDTIVGWLRLIYQKELTIMSIADDLTAAVAANTDLEKSNEAALDTILKSNADESAQITALKAQLAAGTVDPVQVQAAITALMATNTAWRKKLASAIPANTGDPGATAAQVQAATAAAAAGGTASSVAAAVPVT